jgi:hypothetical protein
MGNLVSGLLAFLTSTRVYTQDAQGTVPQGAKSVTAFLVGAGGTGTGQASFDAYWGGGGGEARVLGRTNVQAGDTWTASVTSSSSTSLTIGSKLIASANRGGAASVGNVGDGGSGGQGGRSYQGGSGGQGTQSQGQIGGGGGAGGQAGPGGNGSQNNNGARGAGLSYTDTQTGISYTNGAGGQLYGGGRPGSQFSGARIGGLIALTWLNTPVYELTRVLPGDQASQTLVVPPNVTRVSLALLNSGGPVGYFYQQDVTYVFGGRGGDMRLMADVPCLPGQTITYTVQSGQGQVLLDGQTIIDFTGVTSGGDIRMGGGGSSGTSNQPVYPGGAAGTLGAGGQGSQGNGYGARGLGEAFTDAVSGTTYQNGGGGARWGGGSLSSGYNPGFLAMTFRD